MYLFADDAKMYCHVKNVADKDELQRGIETFVHWTSKWQVSFNINKCKIFSVHHKRYSNMGVAPNYVMNNILLKEVNEIKDLGVFNDLFLVCDKHISEKINKAYMMLGVIMRNFTYISRKFFIILYKALVRSHLEYANSVWYPKRNIDVAKLERVQKRATKLISEISKKPYIKQLQVLKLLTLKYRRYRGDVIEVFKIIKGIYDPACVPHLDIVKLPDDVIRTSGTKDKLIQHHCCYDLRKFNFTNRVLPISNSFSNHVVSADTVNCFKNRLDNFWSNQEVLYNHKTDLHGTSNLSISE